MKLELKHLAPYLPYKLQFIHPLGKFEVIGIKNEQTGVIFNYKGDTFSTYFYEVKPILRPISDLAKLRPQKDVSYIGELWYNVISTDNDCFDKDSFYENCELGIIDLLPIKVLNRLLENHFDVFGLIEKELAIDINTIKNEN